MFFRGRRSTGAAEYIICGLGNPGPKYSPTRHNAGFMALDTLAKGLGKRIDRSKYQALYCEAEISGKKVLLIEPQSYMNLSGKPLKQFAGFYKIPPERIIVIFDDVSLPIGRLRIRAKGSAGGHNGIKSIIEEFGTDEFPRIKLGVGESQYPDLADWVLSRFTDTERSTLDKVCVAAADAAKLIISDGVESAANRFNGFQA